MSSNYLYRTTPSWASCPERNGFGLLISRRYRPLILPTYKPSPTRTISALRAPIGSQSALKIRGGRSTLSNRSSSMLVGSGLWVLLCASTLKLSCLPPIKGLRPLKIPTRASLVRRALRSARVSPLLQIILFKG